MERADERGRELLLLLHLASARGRRNLPAAHHSSHRSAQEEREGVVECRAERVVAGERHFLRERERERGGEKERTFTERELCFFLKNFKLFSQLPPNSLSLTPQPPPSLFSPKLSRRVMRLFNHKFFFFPFSRPPSPPPPLLKTTKTSTRPSCHARSHLLRPRLARPSRRYAL